jgi:hypothetical protein
MNPSASAQIPASTRLRPLLIGLGWLGLVLLAVDWLVDDWQFETTNTLLLRAFDLVTGCWVALWPIAVWLQLKSRLGETGRVIAGGFLILLLIPWWIFCFLFVVFADSAAWEEQIVQYESINPPVRIVQQYRNVFVTSPVQYRVVKITPLWGPWQHVEPADLARFPEVHYR